MFNVGDIVLVDQERCQMTNEFLHEFVIVQNVTAGGRFRVKRLEVVKVGEQSDKFYYKWGYCVKQKVVPGNIQHNSPSFLLRQDGYGHHNWVGEHYFIKYDKSLEYFDIIATSTLNCPSITTRYAK